MQTQLSVEGTQLAPFEAQEVQPVQPQSAVFSEGFAGAGHLLSGQTQQHLDLLSGQTPGRLGAAHLAASPVVQSQVHLPSFKTAEAPTPQTSCGQPQVQSGRRVKPAGQGVSGQTHLQVKVF